MRIGNLDGDEQNQARIAWMYYNDGMTQADIAQYLGMTRARVNRILQIVRENGMVQVVIHSRLASCVALERQLEKIYQLERCVIVPTPRQEQRLFAALGGAAGQYLSGILRSKQTLCLGWGRTVEAAVDRLRGSGLDNVRVITLFGGLTRDFTGNPAAIAAKAAARVNAAECWSIPAPMYVESPELRDMLARQEMFRSVFAKVGQAEIALVGAGDLTLRSTNLLSGAVNETDWSSLLQAGAVGEVYGRFLNESGQVVSHSLNNRFTGPNFSALRRIRHVVLVAGGRQKIPILRAALSKGYAHAFISDEETASELTRGDAFATPPKAHHHAQASKTQKIPEVSRA
ncbi:sugar-binding transcriptional regulator [Desulfonatronum thioautotrophicum]|uniref:sugar-binding transcriptional regulator n=1 Tax=Desulfonatronum thioautotrophicum TaxID=617001 RepID=UPI00069A19F1|nr:sugar-binding transcriptional regulator [Desulfonatronum thioautotrophicum]